MEIPVVIERVGTNGYRASSTAPFPFAVEAETKEKVIEKVRELMQKRAAEGAEVVSVSIPAQRKSLSEWAGYLKDDPHLDAWKAEMKAYRDMIDAEDDRP